MDPRKQTGRKNHVVNGLTDNDYNKQHDNNIRRVNNNTHGSNVQAYGLEATNGAFTDARNRVSGHQNANGIPEYYQVNGHVSNDSHVARSNRSVIVSQNNQRPISVSNSKLAGNNDRSNGTIQQREYTSRNVCELYRHENDVIFGRTRGGVLTGNEVLVVALDTESFPASESKLQTTLNGRQNSDEDELRLDQSSPSSNQTAPLATPESFSDEEVTHNEQREESKEEKCKSSIESVEQPVHLLNADIQNGHTNNDTHDQQDSDDSCNVYPYDDESLADEERLEETIEHEETVPHVESSESLVDNECEPDGVLQENVETMENNQDILDDNILLQVLTEDVKSETSSTEGDGNFVDGIEEDLAMSDTGEGSDSGENNIDEGVGNEDNGEINDMPVELLVNEEQTENDDVNNNDDVGDFIEADLPPNVERLVFFSRDSSSEEDEGCGDEVRQNNDEDVVSENETIDPTEKDYLAPVHKVLNNSYEHSDHGSCNILSNREECVRGELSNLYPCNITCDKSSEENDLDEELEQTFMESQGAEGCSVVECSGCSMHNEASSLNGDKNSWSSKWETCGVCACCDRLVEVNCERQKEMGVIVCDQCFREHSIEQKRWSENLTDFRRKPRPLSASNSNQRSSSGSLTAGSNHFDKVSNNSPLYGRFSSSDSDPFDRIYVSDSSEMVSPEQEAAGEPLFHVAGACSNVESGDAQRKEDNRSSTFPRQSVSLEFTNPDEVLYCPYYTRRSRSLDQYPVLAVEEENNMLTESEGPNIAVDSSNFQDDESNQQQKVFVKAAYNVSPLVPDCSSSDEEENIRVPGTEQQEVGGIEVVDEHRFNQHAGQHGGYNTVHLDYGIYNGGLFQHSVSEHQEPRQKARAEESEPIYEDIDQLGLLLEETCVARGDNSDMLDTQPLCTAISKLRGKRRSRAPVCEVEKVMIWKEYEAYLVQVKQIGTSACGPTAVLNVLKAFDFQVDKEEVIQVIRSNLRMETAPIPYYLFSRYSAGTTADDLVMGIYRLTRGALRGRFFHFYPHRDVQLLKWLGYWMKKGAVPVATLNLQRGVKPGWTIPDAWHHQMVYGVSSKGVYLTNPLEIVPEHVILEQLTSGSVLLVRRQDVVGRFRDWCPLNEILRQPDTRWRTMNVLGQVVHMLREQCMPLDQLVTMKAQLTSHIRIPAAYKAGISLFMRANSDHLHEMMSTPELPIDDKKTDAAS